MKWGLSRNRYRVDDVPKFSDLSGGEGSGFVTLYD